MLKVVEQFPPVKVDTAVAFLVERGVAVLPTVEPIKLAEVEVSFYCSKNGWKVVQCPS